MADSWNYRVVKFKIGDGFLEAGNDLWEGRNDSDDDDSWTPGSTPGLTPGTSGLSNSKLGIDF